jgi:hypothetical protein
MFLSTVEEDEIRRHVEFLRPRAPKHPGELWRQITGPGFVPPHLQLGVFERLTAPQVQLRWATPPAAGEDCVKTFEVQLPPVLQGLTPELWVSFPKQIRDPEKQHADNLLRDSSWQQQHASRRRLILGRECMPEDWQRADLRLLTAGLSTWHCSLPFRLLDGLKGDYLWRFRICLQCSWGHRRLPRLFEADYTVHFEDQNQTVTMSISAGDYAIVNLPRLGKWKNVHLKAAATGHGVIRNSDSAADDSSELHSTKLTPGDADAVLIRPDFRPLPAGWRATENRPVIVQTPVCLPSQNGVGTRQQWPVVERPGLTIQPDSRQPVRLVLHPWDSERPLRLGKDGKNEEFEGRRRKRQDVITRWLPEDSRTLNSSDLQHGMRAISGANTEILAEEDVLVIRNTGTFGSKVPAMTRIDCGQTGPHRLLSSSGEEFRLPWQTCVNGLKIHCGGGILKENPELGELSGYPVEVRAVPRWLDLTSNAWPSLENAEPQVGEFPRSVNWSGLHVPDSLFIRHVIDPGGVKPLHVVLLRSLWLDAAGRPLLPPQDSIREQAAVRLVFANNKETFGRVFLMQLVGDRLALTVQHGKEQEMDEIERFDMIPLLPGAVLRLRSKDSGRLLWTGDFNDLKDESE